MIMQNKRGQLFTIIAIALIILMFISIEIYSQFREKEAIRDRVKSMDSFLQALEQNLDRQAYISGFRIIFLGISERVANNLYVTDLKAFSEEAFFNGTIDGVSNAIMAGATLDDMIGAVNDKARKINVNISMVNTNITMTQEDPWNVKFVISSDFVMVDMQGLASWNKTQNITAYIPIDVFEDPLYLKNAGGRSRKINRTIYEEEYNVSNDLTNLSIHMAKGLYADNILAPSFLGRLTGDLGQSPHGIESFVDINNLTGDVVDAFDPIPRDESVVDYLFFGAGEAGSSIGGLAPRFRIDVGHKARYQLF